MWVFYAVLAMAVYAAVLLFLVSRFSEGGKFPLETPEKWAAALWPVAFIVAAILLAGDLIQKYNPFTTRFR